MNEFEQILERSNVHGQINLSIKRDGRCIRNLWIENTVVSVGFIGMFQSFLDPAKRKYLDAVQFGNDDTPVNIISSGISPRADDTKLSASPQNTYQSDINFRGVNEKYGAFAATVGFELPQGAMTGKVIREMGLFFNDDVMFSRHVLSKEKQFLKTSDLSIEGKWYVFIVRPTDTEFEAPANTLDT